MVSKKLSTVASISALAGILLTSQVVWADSGSAHGHVTPDESNVKTLVALGDSITYGLYLSAMPMSAPSPDAFPSLIANDENLQVDNLGEPGLTSEDMLASLADSSSVQNAVRHAKVVTLDIGSNDLLSIASKDGLLTPPFSGVTPLQELQFESAIQQFGQNLPAILNRIHELSPSAKIVLYNLYNPIPPTQPQLFALGEQLIGQENVILKEAANSFSLPVADAYDAFAGNEPTYIIPGNVHPTLVGQQQLALVGEKVLTEEHFHPGNWGTGDGQ